MRAIIGIIIVFGILYATGQWMWKEPKQEEILIGKGVSNAKWIKDTLPSNIRLLQNEFSEWIVMVDNKYICEYLADPLILTDNIRYARIYTHEYEARDAAKSFLQRSKTLAQQATERAEQKHIQDSINNLRYSTFKPIP